MESIQKTLDGIAIIGMAGRFPGAENINQLFENLINGVESIQTFSDNELRRSGVPESLINDSAYVKRGGVISNPEYFDAAFFGYSPREAEYIDIQQRIFLECAWHAVEDAGYDPGRMDFTTGVFAGCGINNYLLKNLLSQSDQMESIVDLLTFIGNEKDFLSTRVSYKMNFKGPSLTLQTACSTSLVAVQLACQSLLTYQCDMALSGGISIGTPRMKGYLYNPGHILSKDGRCRAFDKEASGTVFGEGVGIVVLKRLEDAITDRDSIYAVIRGIAINNDGSDKVGYTAPSVSGQADVIAMAQALADVTAEDISYVEGHGTGTPMGDPIELAALTQVFRKSTNRKKYCAIGSIKSNLGHLDVAAGVASLIKTALILKNRKIPPVINFKEANPELHLETSPFYVNTGIVDWPHDDRPAIAAVSNFGMGGTNVHCILQEAPETNRNDTSNQWHILPLSAKNESSLKQLEQALLDRFESPVSLKDAAYTLQEGRSHFEYRSAVICRHTCEVKNILSQQNIKRFASDHTRENSEMIFMFSGQGSQYVNMGAGLYRNEPVFRDVIDNCAKIIKKFSGLDILALIYPDSDPSAQNAEELQQTAIVQPALLVIEYAMAKLLEHIGIRADAFIGHSIGEYTAACLSGVFSLEDGLRLVLNRGKLMQEQPAGAMLSVALSAEELQPLLTDALEIALINAPQLTVVSGSEPAIEKLKIRIKEYGQIHDRKIRTTRLITSHAFHSRQMDGAVKPFTELIKTIQLNKPVIPFISNVTGEWITEEEAISPEYWGRQIRNTVRFSDGLQKLIEKPDIILIEVGPGTALATLAGYHLNRKDRTRIFHSMRHVSENEDDQAKFYTLAAQCFCAGVPVEWNVFHLKGNRGRIPMPLYPFQRQKYWIDHTQKTSVPDAVRADSYQQTDKSHETPQNIEGTMRPEMIQQVISDIWKNRIGIESLRMEDNFFDLGGHSLIAGHIIYEVNKRLNLNLQISALINQPVFKDFLSLIETSLQCGSIVSDNLEIQLRPESVPMVLSAAQKRLWFLHIYDPENPAYNLALLLRIHGLVDIDKLYKSTEILLKRHEAFRTAFLNVEGKPEIRIAADPVWNFELIDLKSVKEVQKAELIDRSIKKTVNKPFHFDRPPLYRIHYYSLSADEMVMVLFIPHILTDGWSMTVFHEELASVYDDLLSNRPLQLPELQIQYSDYTAWEQNYYRQINLQPEIDYWKNYLGSQIPTLEFPYDFNRPAELTANGSTFHFKLPEKLSQTIDRFAEKHSITPFIFFLGALHILFHKYSGQDKIIIGTPNANRDNPQVNDIIGFFLNMLAIKAEFSPDLTVSKFFQTIKNDFYLSMDHNRLHFEKLLTSLDIERHINMHPVFQIMFAFQSYLIPKVEKETFAISQEFPNRGLSEYDFSFYMWHEDGIYQGVLEYSTDLLKEPTISRLIDHYGILLTNLTETQQNLISDCSLLSDEEEKDIVVAWNDTGAENAGPENFIELFVEQSRIHGKAPAVFTQNHQLSYRELNTDSNRLAHFLIKQGVRPGALVGVCLEREPLLLVALLGILKAGAGYVPLDPSFPEARLNFMIQDSNLKFLISTNALVSTFQLPDSVKQILLDEQNDVIQQELRTDVSVQVSGDDTAYVIYTSGSTGNPKGVRIHHAALVNFLMAMQETPGITCKDRMLAITTLSFDISCLELYLPLISGAAVVLADSQVSRNGSELIQYIEQKTVTIMQATPATFHMLFQLGWHPSRNLKILCGGEALSLELANRLQDGTESVWNMYGPTETTVWSSIYKLKGKDDKPLIGKPIRNTTFYVLDRYQKPVPAGVIGELYIGGMGVSKGYLNRDDLTAERFIINPLTGATNDRIYRTGDLVRYLGDGNVIYIDRADFQVKLRGFRIELGEIESVLDGHPEVIQSVCAIHQYSENDKRLIAYLKTMHPVDAVILNEYLGKYLPDYMIPNHFQFVESFPLTPNNKVDRKQLPKPMLKMDSSSKSTYELNETEKKLFGIWKQILKTAHFSMNDNFFNLGGHSLLAAELFSMIEKSFGKNIPLSSLFKAPTVRTLAQIIDQASPEDHWSCIVPIQPRGTKKPLFLIHGAEGNILIFRSLASHLPPDQPVYGIQAEALDGRTEIQSDFRIVAGRYIQEIKKVQPHGPYLLGGYCLGGNIALEVAQQLKLLHEKVRLVAMFEAYNENVIKHPLPFHIRKSNEILNVLFHVKNLWSLDDSSKVDFFMEKYRVQINRVKFSLKFNLMRSVQTFGINRNTQYHHLRLAKYFDHSLYDYEVKEYDGRIDCFIPKQGYIGYDDPKCGFGHIAKQGVYSHTIPCFPRGTLVEPFAGNLAENLTRVIDEVTV